MIPWVIGRSAVGELNSPIMPLNELVWFVFGIGIESGFDLI